MSIIDLHIHSNASDGEYSIQKLVDCARQKKISTISITDHDTVEAYEYFDINNIEGVNVIPGIELSIKTLKGRMHMLGYYIDIKSEKLLSRLKELKTSNYYSVLALLHQIKKDYDIEFDPCDMTDILKKRSNLGRVDIAKLLLKYNYVSGTEEAFVKYLNPAYDKNREIKKGLTIDEGLKLIKEAGGVVSLAHPKTLLMNYDELDLAIRDMKEMGLDAIEVFHSEHSNEEVTNYLELAEKYNLSISGGSDFHGPTVKPNIFLGSGKNNLKIKNLSLIKK